MSRLPALALPPGTPGPDVVVTNGAISADTGDGDDLTCTTATQGFAAGVGVGVDVGAGEDTVDTAAGGPDGNVASTSDISGGAGRDGPDVNVTTAGRWVFDNRSGEARHDGATAWRWAGLEQFFLTQIKTVGQVSFIGGPADDLLYLSTSGFVGARLGGGNDDVFVASPRA